VSGGPGGEGAAMTSERLAMPAWLSHARVYAAWLGVLGLDGLGHYGLAPPSAHTSTMNLTIGLEVAAALTLLAAVTWFTLRLLREHHGAAYRDDA
jgi:hypothetical protein